MKYSPLSEFARYQTGKIPTCQLTVENYISTENMLPDKRGVSTASSLPSTVTTASYSEGDILISNIRPYFKKIWYATCSGGCSNDVLVIRTLENHINKFLYYALSDDNFFAYAVSTSKGTKMPRGDKASLMKYMVPAFDSQTQSKIAEILSSIDKKIELNQNINHNLEEQAQAIFKSWFVDFEPFRDGEFIDSELGPIPKGWRVGRLSELVTVIKKVEKFPNTKTIIYEHYSIPAFDAGMQPSYDVAALIKSNKTHIEGGCFLVSKLNPAFKRVWYPYCETSHSICSPEFIAFKPIDSEQFAFCYAIAGSSNFYSYLNRNATGTTGSRQRISPATVLEYLVIMPQQTVLRKFCSAVNFLYQEIQQGYKQSRTLAALRDTLLPKLMSGEIDVSQIKI